MYSPQLVVIINETYDIRGQVHVRSRWAQLHIYIIIVSFMILWCQSMTITLETAKDQVISVSDDIAVSASSILRNAHQEKLDRIGLIGWAIIGFGILTVGFFGFQNSRQNRKRYRYRSVSTNRRTYQQKRAGHGGAVLSSRDSAQAAYQRYGRNIEMRR